MRPGMDRDQAISRLPTSYAVAVRMRDKGASDAAIAEALGVPTEAIARLVEIADAKLRALGCERERR